MTLRLDPRYPLVWRTPFSVQLGIDPGMVVLDDLTPIQERMLAALTVGISAPGLAMMARGHTEEHDALLAALVPVLARPARDLPVPTVAISGSETTVTAIAAALAGSGVRTVLAADAADLADCAPDLAIAAGHFVLDPELHAFWLRRDVPHLPVVLSDTGVTVGPIVEPGTGPCLLCLELHRRDADDAWPAIATQLLGRRSHVESAVLLTEAAGAVGRLVIGRLSDGPAAAASLRIDGATGARSYRQWQPHEDCGCRGLSPARPGTDWASAARRAPAVR
jgi:hypothetical protein